MNGPVVVDASLAVKWLVKEEYSDQAIDLARFWESEGTKPAAPYLMPVEVANALHRRVVRSELTVAAATRLLEHLVASGIELQETPAFTAEQWNWRPSCTRERCMTRIIWRWRRPSAVICGPLTRGSSGR